MPGKLPERSDRFPPFLRGLPKLSGKISELVGKLPEYAGKLHHF